MDVFQCDGDLTRIVTLALEGDNVENIGVRTALREHLLAKAS